MPIKLFKRLVETLVGLLTLVLGFAFIVVTISVPHVAGLLALAIVVISVLYLSTMIGRCILHW